MWYTITAAVLASLCLLPDAALAHAGAAHGSGLGAGFLHPLLGWDHLLAMLAVGIWSAQLDGHHRWRLPLAFIAALLFGTALGAAGPALPFVETGILLSVLVLGAFISLTVRVPALTATLLVALFALAHGHAHGSEMPASLDGLGYGVGIALATALLQLAGFAFLHLLRRWRLERLAPYSGTAILAGGLLLAMA